MDSKLKNFKVRVAGDESIFWHKLTKEYGWSLTYAESAYKEYLKFIHLLITANQRVVPSQIIDKVWHIHMTFTQSYWNDLCKGILQQEVHHVPSNVKSMSKQVDLKHYDQTRQLYQQIFGYEPPKAFWGVKSSSRVGKITAISLASAMLLTACTTTFNDDTILLFKWAIGLFAVYKVAKWLLGAGGGGKGGSGGGAGCGSSCGGGCGGS